MRWFSAIFVCFVCTVLFDFWGFVIGVFLASTIITFSKKKHRTDEFQSEFADGSTGSNTRFEPEPESQEVVINASVMASFFEVAGCIAKSDGRISPEEIEEATEMMERLALPEKYRRIAIESFNRGKSQDFDLTTSLNRLRSSFGRNRFAGTILFEAMVNMSKADGIDEVKAAMLMEYASALGVRSSEADAYIENARYTRSRRRFYSESRTESATSKNSLESAYQTLGVDKNESDGNVKQAYRRLIQESHPDRLVAKDLPDFLIEAANAKTREIQEAWETVRKSRGIV